LNSAEKLASRFPHTEAISLDVGSAGELDKIMPNYDVLISLVPYLYHAAVIKSAIKHKTQVVATSYVSETIKGPRPCAKGCWTNCTVLNEVGVDPDVDHLANRFVSLRPVEFN
jgi:saccharopine dehydrogenase-like NADP-dependent oxidoreductase